MSDEHFVGRDDAVKRLHHVLTGDDSAAGNLTVQSIEGPGGIGKTFLLNHAIACADLTNRNYLTLRMDGNDPSARTLVRAVSRMVDSAEAEAIRGRASGYYFPSVDRVVKAIETIRSEAIAEFQRRHPDNEEGQLALLQFLDLAFEAGKRVNDAIPITRKQVNFHGLEKVKRLIEETVPLMVSLREEVPWMLELLGIYGSTSMRNAIKENTCRPLADALVSDLSAILKRYRTADLLKASHSKVRGIDRLLLILDDYEVLQDPLGEFLVGYLLSALRSANFQSVVIILCRDQLKATHPSWDMNFKPNLLIPIELKPFSEQEMDQLVESYGVTAKEEKERAWGDTQGYPYFVQLWIEEMMSGGRSAVMLKRFHDRTTRWMNDRQKRWLQYTLFLDEVNRRTLEGLLGNKEEADEAFRWFERDGSVRDTSGSVFRVREYLRSRLVDYLRISDPDLCDQLRSNGDRVMNGKG